REANSPGTRDYARVEGRIGTDASIPDRKGEKKNVPPYNQSKFAKKMRHRFRFFREFLEGGRFMLVCDLNATSQELSIIKFRTTLELLPGFREDGVLLG